MKRLSWRRATEGLLVASDFGRNFFPFLQHELGFRCVVASGRIWIDEYHYPTFDPVKHR